MHGAMQEPNNPILRYGEWQDISLSLAQQAYKHHLKNPHILDSQEQSEEDKAHQ